MDFYVLTLFPELIEYGMNTSITGRAQAAGILRVRAVNIRDYAEEKRKSRVDDYPYGGGAGMVMQAEPVYRACCAVREMIAEAKIGEEKTGEEKIGEEKVGEEKTGEEKTGEEKIGEEKTGEEKTGEEKTGEEKTGGEKTGEEKIGEEKIGEEKSGEEKIRKETVCGERRVRVVHMTPQGARFTQEKAVELAQEEELIFLCGHYEGIDERVLEEIVTDEISIGDYVLTGGELPALVVMDAVARMVPGVLTNAESGETESFRGDGLLEYPQYTRPEEWRGRSVPPILLSGNHGAVDQWRREQSFLRTAERRPDLCHPIPLSKADKRFLRENNLIDKFE